MPIDPLMARVSYIEPDDVPEDDVQLLRTSMTRDELPEVAATLLDDRVRNVHRAIANNRPVLRTFRRANATLWNESGLTDRQRELVVLTVARGSDAAYEWHQHIRHALNAGVTVEEIRAISRGEWAAFGGEERALVAYVSAYVKGAVTDAEHDSMTTYFEASTVVGVAMLAGAYLGLAHTLDALAVEPEEKFVGWDLENL